jgi:lipoyl(octanoyl) transferase
MGEAVLSRERWRLIGLDAERGDWNMAVDEALLESASRSTPTLRLFTWSEPCLSVGCLQPTSDIDLAACQRAGLPLVRRASGGTAVLHENTLGFSIVVPPGHRFAVSDIVESYRLLAPAAQLALKQLGVPCELVQPEQASRGRSRGLGSAACFAELAPYELVVGPRKVVGNSQLRRRGAILHHAVIHLDLNPGRFAGFLKTNSLDEIRQLSRLLDSRIGSLASVVGRPVRAEEAADCARSAFAEAFGVELVPGALTSAERETAQKLVAEKYGSPSWTYRR